MKFVSRLLDPLPPEVASALQVELADGERLVWTVQPIARRLALYGLFVAGMSVFFLGAAGMMLSQFIHGLRQHSWSEMIAAPGVLLFGFVGVQMLLTPWLNYRKARRTVYAVTDRRALSLTVKGRPGERFVRNFLPAEMGEYRRDQRADGSGHLILGQESYWRKGRERFRDAGFFAVPDAEQAWLRVGTLLMLENRRRRRSA